MTSTVYHANYHRGDRDVSFGLGLRPDPHQLIAWLCEGRLRYRLVATCETDDPSQAFFLTNTIDHEWWKNPGVFCHIPNGTRSTSAGDVTIIGPKHTLYAGIGYADLPFDIETHSSVFAGLDNAMDNGYDMSDTPNMTIAEDLVTNNSELEGKDPMMLVVHILMWKKWIKRNLK